MKDGTNEVVSTSRRNFTTALLTAAAAAPLAASMPGCSKPTADPCSCPDPKGQPVKCSFVIPGLELEPHEPPIGGGGGSFKLETYRPLVLKATSGSAARPFKYEPTTPYYTEIYKVQVISEKEKYFLSDHYYLNFRQSYLGIWLQNNRAVAGSPADWYPPIVSGTEPQILFTFVNRDGINYFVLESDAELRPSASFKQSRPYRYDHPDYTAGQHFRFAKWSLFYPTPADVITGLGGPFEEDLSIAGSSTNAFQVLVSFEHVDHYRARKNIPA